MINTEMNKDEDKIVLWNEKNRTKMIAFLTSIIAGFLTYLFLMTNLMSNSDAIMLYSDGTKFDLHAALGGAATGRWLLAIVEELVSPYKSPLLIGTIDIILTALTSYLCVDILKIKKDINAIILGSCVYAVFKCKILIRLCRYSSYHHWNYNVYDILFLASKQSA